MMNLRVIPICVAFLLLAITGYAQIYSNNTKVEEVLTDIYNYKFKSAETKIDVYTKDLPEEDLKSLTAYFNWWKLLSGYHNTEAVEAQLKTAITELKHAVSETDRPSARLQTMDLMADFLMARLNLLNGNNIKAINSFTSCIEKSNKLDEVGLTHKFEELLIARGLYNYYLEEAYENYVLLRPVLYFYEFDGDLGYQMLEQASKSEHKIIRTEAMYFLLKIHTGMNKDTEKARSLSIALTHEFPDNLLYRYLALKHTVKDSESYRENKTTLMNLLEDNEELPPQVIEHFKTLLSSQNL